MSVNPIWDWILPKKLGKVSEMRRKILFGSGFLVAGLLVPAAHADTPQLQILPQSELKFGSFAVPSRGSIEVGPTGLVSRSGVISVASGDTGPARFTVRYDRGTTGANASISRSR